MARKLIEKARRRAEFDPQGCVAIRLADGQDWFFPRPILELRPRFTATADPATGYLTREDLDVGHLNRYVTHGEDLDGLIEAIGQAEPSEALILAVLRLGGDLLLRNYDLMQDELERLFRYRVDDETGASDKMLSDIIDVATGRLRGAVANPKRPGGGSC